MAKVSPKLVKDGSNGAAVLGVSSSKQDQVISKKEMGQARSLLTNLDGFPRFGFYSFVNGSGESLRELDHLV